MLRNTDERQHRICAEPGKSNSSYTSELCGAAIQKQERALVGLKGTQDALKNLPGSIREFVVRCCNGPHVGDRSQDAKEAEEFRIVIHHRRSDGIRQSNYNIAPGLVQSMKL